MTAESFVGWNVGVVPLEPFVHQDPLWCARCAGKQTFVSVFEFEGGRLGYCMGCGEERVKPDSRTNSEAA